MKFLYRAQTYEYTLRPLPAYVKPRVINWRFQPPHEKFECTPRPIAPYIKPKWMNWRFQMSSQWESSIKS